jgi:hypothetical protein
MLKIILNIPINFVQNSPILRVDPIGLLDNYGLDTETGEKRNNGTNPKYPHYINAAIDGWKDY